MAYITECLEDLKAKAVPTARASGFRRDEYVMKVIMGDLVQARKFVLPSPSKLNIKVTQPAMEHLRLPHPICAFEFPCPEAREEGINAGVVVKTVKSTRRVALAYDCSKDVGPVPMLKSAGSLAKDAAGIAVISLYYIDKWDMWVPSMGIGYIDKHVTADTHVPLKIDNTIMQGQMEAYPILFDTIDRQLGQFTKQQRTNVLVNDTAEETMVAVRAALLWQARNLNEIKVVEAPKALNKKREKKGKFPFFDYYTLDLFIAESPDRAGRKKVNFSAVHDLLKKANTRIELRPVSGHFKVRKTGIFYWNEHQRKTHVKGAPKQ